jgi:nucleoside-diphosphate-sugar epimerase
MARVLVAGCGYVGLAAARLFHAAGWDVEGWTGHRESAEQLTGEPFPITAVDLTQRASMANRDRGFDAVIHCASTRGGNANVYRSTYLEGARNLLQTFPEATLLLASSTSVYAQTNGEWVTEESPAEPTRETGRVLREAESLVLAHGGIVTRLAGIYGPGRSFLLRQFLEGKATVDLARDRFINQAHRDDIAAAFFLLVKERASPRVRGNIFNVVDDEPKLRSECLAWLASHLGRAPASIGSDEGERKRGESNKRVSNAKLRRLGWKPRFPTFSDAMEASILPAENLSGMRK